MYLRNAGIVGWGTYIPRYRIKVHEIARLWGYDLATVSSLGMEEKSVEGPDEDAVTMGIEAARYALMRAGVDPKDIGAVFFGTESKPYAVKPSATIVAEALGITPNTMASDLEFACRAASEGLRAALALVEARYMRYALVVASDTAQANPGNILELTASSGAAAYIVGPANEAVAVLEGVYSFVTDTPDFWRREGTPYPLHGEAFTGEPSYFKHIVAAVEGLMKSLGLKPSDFDYAVFHQPNGVFPLRVAKMLGIDVSRVRSGLVTPVIGNTYNASALIGFAKVLEEAKPGQRILLVPFGSGAGADAYSFIVTDRIVDRVDRAPTVEKMISRKVYIDYATYARFRRILRRYVEE